jgi:hypothetical protein
MYICPHNERHNLPETFLDVFSNCRQGSLKVDKNAQVCPATGASRSLLLRENSLVAVLPDPQDPATTPHPDWRLDTKINPADTMLLVRRPKFAAPGNHF